MTVKVDEFDVATERSRGNIPDELVRWVSNTMKQCGIVFTNIDDPDYNQTLYIHKAAIVNAIALKNPIYLSYILPVIRNIAHLDSGYPKEHWEEFWTRCIEKINA